MELKNKIFEQFILQNLFGKNYTSAYNKISKVLHVNDKVLSSAINELLTEKKIKLKNKRYICEMEPVSGILHGNKNKFYLETKEQHNFIPISNTNGAKDGDIVNAYIFKDSAKDMAVVASVLQKQDEYFYGRVVQLKSNAIILIDGDNNRILLPTDEISINCIGKNVCVKLESKKDGHIPTGSIYKVYGNANDPITENIIIAEKHGFRKQFSEKVLKELNIIPDSVTENDIKNRTDLRKLPIFTIDPEGCKDKDDAVYLEKTEFGYRLVGAIADVSHYVGLGTSIDKEAYKRGTSCYLGDGVYPMLPEKLSNGICSLDENVDRLAMCVAIDFDNNGKRLRYSIKPAVIRSKHSLSYNIADKIHLNQDKMHEQYAEIKKQIDIMFELSDKLVKERTNRGAIMLNSKEPDYVLDDTKTNVEKVDNHNELISTTIIESFMLAINEAIGDFFVKNNLLTLRRVHLSPFDSQINELNFVLKKFDLPLVNNNSKSYQCVLNAIKDKPYEEYITYNILRSLQKAYYSPELSGHFGLASKNYIQFTSPIRRYPDLVTHRILHSYLANKNYLPSYEELDAMGLHLSKKELDAKDAEIESNNLMNAIWAENHIGEILTAKVFNIEPSRVIVQSGLITFSIPMHDFLKLGYQYDRNRQCLKRYDNKLLKITDSLPIIIQKADRTKREITATCNFNYNNKFNADKIL